MPDKAYAILLTSFEDDDESGYLYFPIKRAGLPYAGMPQFFGGTKNVNESDRDAIRREMLEESDAKITLEPGGLTRVHSATVGGSRYSFYVATRFSGHGFLGPLKNGEMSSIRRFFVQVGQRQNMEDLLRSLAIVPSEEFMESETYVAFERAIEWSEMEIRALV